MDGILITDSRGREIVSSRFSSREIARRCSEELKAHANDAPQWFWLPVSQDQNKVNDDASATTNMRLPGDKLVCQMQKDSLRFAVVVDRDIDPMIPMEFLVRLYRMIQESTTSEGFLLEALGAVSSMIGGKIGPLTDKEARSILVPLTEASIKDNIDIVLVLLEEALGGNFPADTENALLKEVVSSAPMIKRAIDRASATAGLPVLSSNDSQSLMPYLNSPVAWRRSDVKHKANEVYIDMVETLSAVFDCHTDQIITGSLSGTVHCLALLSGLPTLELRLTEAAQLACVSLDRCVKHAKWVKSKVVNFMPPDNPFVLMRYGVASGTVAGCLPFSLRVQLTRGAAGCAFSFSVIANRPLKNIVLEYLLPKGSSGLTASSSLANRSSSETPSHWDVDLGYLRWHIHSLSAGQALLEGQFSCPSESQTVPYARLKCDIPKALLSGVSVAGLELMDESYKFFKGAKSTAHVDLEIRL